MTTKKIPKLSKLIKDRKFEVGFCHCGCGDHTNIITGNQKKYGYIKGNYFDFIKGHQMRGKPTRPEIKAKISGENHYLWQGENPSYKAAHDRVSKARGKPDICEVCLKNKPSKGKRMYDWANLTGKLHNVLDYKRMCRSCHRKHDASKRKAYTYSLEAIIKELKNKLQKYEKN